MVVELMAWGRLLMGVLGLRVVLTSGLIGRAVAAAEDGDGLRRTSTTGSKGSAGLKSMSSLSSLREAWLSLISWKSCSSGKRLKGLAEGWNSRLEGRRVVTGGLSSSKASGFLTRAKSGAVVVASNGSARMRREEAGSGGGESVEGTKRLLLELLLSGRIRFLLLPTSGGDPTAGDGRREPVDGPRGSSATLAYGQRR